MTRSQPFPPPPCTSLGPQCRSLRVTLRASSALGRTERGGDHEATWLLGHTERLTFGRMWKHGEDLFARAVIHVPCKYFAEGAPGEAARCRAHGFEGPPPPERAARTQRRRLGAHRFRLVEGGRLRERRLAPPRPHRPAARPLPVLTGGNPCATAHCRTSDHTVGAACCRDLQIEVMCDRSWVRQEALLRSRRPPYLCKVHRDSEESLEAELISACDYLDEDGISCVLHGRRRPDGRPAKPDLCRRWPKPTEDETLHPGCVFAHSAPRGCVTLVGAVRLIP